jgi:hypothetical protein
VKERHQRNIAVEHHGFFSAASNDQASLTKPTEWFWKGLERFANTDDSLESYSGLAKGWPTFWPVAIEDHGRSLAWTAEAHSLFVFYRNILRGLWTHNPETSTNGTYVNLLFGTVAPVEQLKRCFPDITPAVATTSFWPEWGAGAVRYVSYNDFQRAIWLLFRESWRAKVCAKCAIYFIAAKPAQSYCSNLCSSRAHQSSSLRWWREKGSQRRIARDKNTRKTKQKGRGADIGQTKTERVAQFLPFRFTGQSNRGTKLSRWKKSKLRKLTN